MLVLKPYRYEKITDVYNIFFLHKKHRIFEHFLVNKIIAKFGIQNFKIILTKKI